ncbi:hypothetical protein MHL30_06655 [Priestia flexa]|uniref:hypothetical protein n=1 Tax=Priestia flexa TaxID=86664 RepID=UPI001EF708C8|nr:hypothetical protein [Priestia flexa]MCG7312854.1 hypothetical protein [Priestia flexa]
MEWSVGHSTPAGKRGKTEIPQRSEEAQVPPRGKRVSVAQWNERVETNQRDGNSECSSFRSNHFVMSQTLFYHFLKIPNGFPIGSTSLPKCVFNTAAADP